MGGPWGPARFLILPTLLIQATARAAVVLLASCGPLSHSAGRDRRPATAATYVNSTPLCPALLLILALCAAPPRTCCARGPPEFGDQQQSTVTVNFRKHIVKLLRIGFVFRFADYFSQTLHTRIVLAHTPLHSTQHPHSRQDLRHNKDTASTLARPDTTVLWYRQPGRSSLYYLSQRTIDKHHTRVAYQKKTHSALQHPASSIQHPASVPTFQAGCPQLVNTVLRARTHDAFLGVRLCTNAHLKTRETHLQA